MAEFSSSVSHLGELANKIKEQVVFVKQKKHTCVTLCELVKALTPVLADVQEKYPVLPQNTKDTLCRFIPKIKKSYDETLDFVEAQVKVGSVKKFNPRKTTKHLDSLMRTLKEAKESLISALFDRMDPSVCTTPIPSTVGIDQHVESMFLAFQSENFMQALHIGKEVLKKVPHDDLRSKAGIHYDMACAYSKMFNAQSAVAHLQSARSFGFSDFKQLDEDIDFDNIRFQPEFMNLRQIMEFEVLQTDGWRTLNEHTIYKLSALFDKYDNEGLGTLSFPKFHALCKASFGISSIEQVVAFWRETCEETVEAMHLVEFLNFVAEHKDINGLARSINPYQKANHYNGYAPIHTSSLVFPFQEARCSAEVQAQHYTHTFQFPPFSYSVESQSCGWMSEAPPTSQEQRFTTQQPIACVSAPFSYYTTNDPLANFR